MNKKLVVMITILLVVIITIFAVTKMSGNKENEKKPEHKVTKKVKKEKEKKEENLLTTEDELLVSASEYLKKQGLGEISKYYIYKNKILAVTKTDEREYGNGYEGEKLVWVTKDKKSLNYQVLMNRGLWVKTAEYNNDAFIQVRGKTLFIAYENEEYTNKAYDVEAKVYLVDKKELKEVYQPKGYFAGIQLKDGELYLMEKRFDDATGMHSRVNRPYYMHYYKFTGEKMEEMKGEKYIVPENGK